jgi:hypothetical protein
MKASRHRGVYNGHRAKAFGLKHLYTLQDYVRSYFTTDSQYVLVSSTLVGLATRYYFLSEYCCLKLAVLYLLGALSDERTRLQFAA